MYDKIFLTRTVNLVGYKSLIGITLIILTASTALAVIFLVGDDEGCSLFLKNDFEFDLSFLSSIPIAASLR